MLLSDGGTPFVMLCLLQWDFTVSTGIPQFASNGFIAIIQSPKSYNFLSLLISHSCPAAHLWAYLVYWHLADALYDSRVEERIRFIKSVCSRILTQWNGEDIEQLIELVRCFSNEIEYDDEKPDKMIS